MDKNLISFEKFHQQLTEFLRRWPAADNYEDLPRPVEELVESTIKSIGGLTLHYGSQKALELVTQLYDISEPSSPARFAIAKALNLSAARARGFPHFKYITDIFIAVPDLPLSEKKVLEKELIVGLVYFLSDGQKLYEVANILHWLCNWMTADGLMTLHDCLVSKLGYGELELERCKVVIDLVFSHETLQQDELQQLCLLRLIGFIENLETADMTFKFILEIWHRFSESFKANLISASLFAIERNFKIQSDIFPQFLSLMIKESYKLTPQHRIDRELTQSRYLILLLQFSSRRNQIGDEILGLFYDGKHRKDFYFPFSRFVASVYLIIDPLLKVMPNSVINNFLHDRKIFLRGQIGTDGLTLSMLNRIDIIFSNLLPSQELPEEALQLQRLLLSAIGSLRISSNGEAVELSKEMLKTLIDYLSNLPAQEHRQWRKLWLQIWKHDAKIGTPDVDRQKLRTRLQLLWQTNAIF